MSRVPFQFVEKACTRDLTGKKARNGAVHVAFVALLPMHEYALVRAGCKPSGRPELSLHVLCRLANTLKNMQRSGQVTNVTAAGR